MPAGHVPQHVTARSALVAHKEHLRDSMTPNHLAGLMWGLSMASHTYFLAPYDSRGQPPSPKLEYWIVNARECTIPIPINLPYGFAATLDAPPRPTGYDRVDTSFGEQAAPKQQQMERINPNVDPTIKAMCNQMRQVDPYIMMAGLLRNTSVLIGKVVLVDGNCVDFHSFGNCCRGVACHFQHDPTARPLQERVAAFMDLVKPVADALASRHPGKRARGRG
jgi:hypothetical protein